MTSQCDLLVHVGAALPMVDDGVIYDAIVAVRAGRIVAVAPADSAGDWEADATIADPDAVVLPGLVNAHTHVGAHFFGTLANDGNLITALYHLLFPMAHELDAEMMHAAGAISLWDAVKSGVTTVCDHYPHPDATARAAERVGVRALVAGEITEFSLGSAPEYDPATRTYDIRYDRAEADRKLEQNVRFVEAWREHPLVTPCLGPHAADTLSTEVLSACARAADDLDVTMLIHVAQSPAEVAQVQQRGYRGAIHYLDDIGFLSPRVHGAHVAFVDEEEVRIAAASGMSASFNPVSNIWCNCFSPVDLLLESGMRVGFGTDGAAPMDELEEMRYAILSSNYLRGAGGFVLTAFRLLQMATIDGARALGVDGEIGTLEVGKKADLAVINLRDAQFLPITNLHEAVAYYAKSRNVTHTVIDGRVVYADGQLQLADQHEIYAEAERLAREWVKACEPTLRRRGIWDRIQPHFFAAPRRAADPV